MPELHYAGFPEPDGNAMVTRFLSPPNKCFFCMGTFPDMFALLLHMRTSYPRLDIVYRVIRYLIFFLQIRIIS